MKRIFTYQFFLKSIVIVVLFGQLWTNSLSYCIWMIDADSEFIEISNSEESESEEESEESKKEKDDKIRSGFLSKSKYTNLSKISLIHSKVYLTLHHPELTTPPPQSFIFIS